MNSFGWRLSLSWLVVMALAGCDAPKDDLPAWIAAQKNKPSMEGPRPFKGADEGRMADKPLPAASSPWVYLSKANVDPFADKQLKSVGSQTKASTGISPNLQRRKESLETFPLESLRFVGVMRQADQMVAIIKSPKGSHGVLVGRYMGQNHGQVQSISQDKMVLREIIQQQDGEWIYQSTSLTLQEAGS
jgi:type IV pilus assembly protein PilP